MPDIGVQIELKPTGYKNVNTKNEKKKKKGQHKGHSTVQETLLGVGAGVRFPGDDTSQLTFRE